MALEKLSEDNLATISVSQFYKLRQNFFNKFSMHISQAVIATSVAIGQFFVVEAHQMQHRGVQIMHMGSVFDGSVTKFVRRSIRHSPLDSAAGKPN